MDKNSIISKINHFVKDTMIDYLDIKFTDAGEGYIEATMPVNHKTFNPAKTLHGGAMMALAETVGSGLSHILINSEKQDVRGLEINGNHVKGANSGFVTARATIVHKGRRTHVCEIKITDQNGALLNISRMTNMIIDR